MSATNHDQRTEPLAKREPALSKLERFSVTPGTIMTLCSSTTRWITTVALGFGFGLGMASAAQADGGALMPTKAPAAYLQECGSCHLAYPPGLLPARSWQRLMSGLDKHFDSDASLDIQTVQQLSAWLQAHAATSKGVGGAPPQDRITRSAWFERKHRQIDSSVWHLPSVKTAAHCSACHAGADRGRFDDDNLRVPEGLNARQRRAWND